MGDPSPPLQQALFPPMQQLHSCQLLPTDGDEVTVGTPSIGLSEYGNQRERAAAADATPALYTVPVPETMGMCTSLRVRSTHGEARQAGECMHSPTHESEPDSSDASAVHETAPVDKSILAPHESEQSQAPVTRKRTGPGGTATGRRAAPSKRKRVVRAQAATDRKAFENEALLAAEPGGRWREGVMRVGVEAEDAEGVLRHMTDAKGKLKCRLRVGSRTLRGFENWGAVHTKHNPRLQRSHTLLIGRSDRRAARTHIPGLARIVDGLLRRLPPDPDGCKLEWLNAHALDQGSGNARFEDHQDTTEEQERDGGRRDRKVVYTVVLKLNRGGRTSMRVRGQCEVFYRIAQGNGFLFRSQLHHRTCKAERGIIKLSLFFGYFLS